MHFTFSMNDYANFRYYKVHCPLYTADGVTYRTGEETVILPLESGKTIELTSVALVPNLTNKLISMGALLREGMQVCASTTSIFFYKKNELVIAFEP